jgi:hypothetical protein
MLLLSSLMVLNEGTPSSFRCKMKCLFPLFFSIVFLCSINQIFGDDFISPQGYKITYPRGWRVASQSEFDNMVRKFSDKVKGLSAVFFGPRHKGFAANLNVIVDPQTFKIDENNEKELIDTIKERNGNNCKVKTIDINGIKSVSLAFETEKKDTGETLRTWQVIIPGKERKYVFTFGTLKSTWEDDWTSFDEMIKSVRVDLPSDLAQKPIEVAPYLTRRSNFKTILLQEGPAPTKWTNAPPPKGVKIIEYESEGRKLKAWLYVPKLTEKEKRPALVYMHGLFALDKDDILACHAFTEARFIVLCPAFRAENGNSGNFEMLFGEVDDAAAAIKWLASQKNVDSKQIYVFGHSSGGVISAMLSLYDKLPVVHTGSAGGLYGPELFDLRAKEVPFELNDSQERQMRVLIGNIQFMKRPHYAFVGTEDIYMKKDIAKEEASKSHAPLTIIELPGDHSSTLAPAMQKYLEIIEQEDKK